MGVCLWVIIKFVGNSINQTLANSVYNDGKFIYGKL